MSLARVVWLRMWWMRRIQRMRMWVSVLLLTACANAGVPDNVPATSPPPPPGASTQLDSLRAIRGESLEFSVLTYGPGDEVFERFGHIALAMHDRISGEDIAFNWGMFDFNEPHFILRFLTGDTRYWMEGYYTAVFNTVYQEYNRSIRKQVLNLSAVQRGALHDYLMWNAQEANKYYRYDYYRDNCSTRVRDILDWALGGALRQALEPKLTNYTWRGETERITADNLPVYAGIEVALGRHADSQLSEWDDAFLPERLADAIASVRQDEAQFVALDTVLFTASREPIPLQAPSRVLSALIISVILAAIIFVLSRLPKARSVVTVFGVLWYGVGGIVGTALLLAGTVTKHEPYMGSNLSILLFNPLLLVAAVWWPWRARNSQAGRTARALAFLVAAFAVIAAVMLLIPALYQRSLVVFAATLPLYIALALSTGISLMSQSDIGVIRGVTRGVK